MLDAVCLWQCSDSLSSSTDLDTTTTSNINFEEKLKEAAGLLEKVRKTLKDIGTGINKIPDAKKMDATVNPPMQNCKGKCKSPSCSSHGQSTVEQVDTATDTNDDEIDDKNGDKVGAQIVSKAEENNEEVDEQENLPKVVDRGVVKGENLEQMSEIIDEKKLADESKQTKEIVGNGKTNDQTKTTTSLDNNSDAPISVGDTEEQNEYNLETLKMLQEISHESSAFSFSKTEGKTPETEEKESVAEEKTEIETEERTSIPGAFSYNTVDIMEQNDSIFKSDIYSIPDKLAPVKEEKVSHQEVTKYSDDQEQKCEVCKTAISSEEKERKDTNTSKILRPTIEKIESTDPFANKIPSRTVRDDRNATVLSISDNKQNLSIQVMPPVNIRGGLVMQRTLNLCIKPTGSVINDLNVDKPNIYFEEVKADSREGNAKTPGKCPEECRNPDDGLCIARTINDVKNDIEKLKQEVQINMSGSKILDHDADKVSTEVDMTSQNTRQDALIVFRSFQIVDDDCETHLRNVQMSTAISHKMMEQNNTSPASPCENGPENMKLREGATVKKIFPKIENGLYHSMKSPWEIGFYKSQATQCSETSLRSPARERTEETTVKEEPPDVRKEIVSSDGRKSTIRDASSTDSEKMSISSNNTDRTGMSSTGESEVTSELQKPNFTEEEYGRAITTDYEHLQLDEMARRSAHEQHQGTASIPPIVEELSSHKSSLAESTDSKKKSDSTSLETSTSEEDGKESPVKDYPKPDDATISELMSILSEKKGHNVELPSKSTSKKPSVQIDVAKLAGKGSKDKTMSQKISSQQKSSSSTGDVSSSYSSENIHGSRDSSTEQIRILNIKESPHSPYSEKHVARHAVPKKPKNENGGRRSPTTEEKKEESLPRVVKEPPNSEGTKPKDPSTHPDQKTDANMQTDIVPSSEETSSEEGSSSGERDRMNTIKDFIRGLTGTSQDELAKLTSNPSVPKTDLPNYSRTMLRTLKEEHHKRTVSSTQVQDEISAKESKEMEVRSMNYAPSGSGELTDDDLSVKAKQEKLKQFQKLTSGKISAKEKVVMNMTVQRGESGEGRQLPFYRRVLGKIKEHKKKPVGFSQSEAYPIEESISEGEIKCKSTTSAGEILPVKYIRNASNKVNISAAKYLKKQQEQTVKKDLGSTVAKQRTQYNDWVTHYLQKHHSLPYDGDSSFSTMNTSSKK